MTMATSAATAAIGPAQEATPIDAAKFGLYRRVSTPSVATIHTGWPCASSSASIRRAPPPETAPPCGGKQVGGKLSGQTCACEPSTAAIWPPPPAAGAQATAGESASGAPENVPPSKAASSPQPAASSCSEVRSCRVS